MLLFAAQTVLAVTQKEAMKEIFAAADSFKAKKCGDIDYFEVSKENSAIGYCINVTARGYSGPICMVVGLDPEGVIKGIRIIAHRETPGIGARINEILAGEKEPWFLRQFVGKQGRTVMLKKDVDAVSGATISSNAVTTAVNGAANAFFARIKK